MESAPKLNSKNRDQPGAAPGVQGALPPHYLEPVDNVSFEAGLDITNWLTATCDRGKGYFIVAKCPEGHRFAKVLVCNKEWCAICGDNDSIAHLRRFARWLPKAQQIKSMGYFIFTLPKNIRSKYRTKKALATLGHKVQELLKFYGYSRGLRRWHFFGSKSSRWHPHLNVLVDGEFLSPQQLKAIKKDYAALLNVPLADVNYQYRPSPGKIIHSLKYVTRATFRDYDWDIDMASELHGFRNMVVWGRGLWSTEPAWQLSDLNGLTKAELEELDVQAISTIVTGLCPVCNQPLVWGQALPIGLLNMVEKQSLGTGYYRVPDTPPRPYSEPEKVDYHEVKKARGDYRRLELHVRMARQRVKWLKELENMGIHFSEDENI